MPRAILPRLDPAPIRRMLSERGWTHADLAERAGIGPLALSRRLYEPMTWDTADKVAVALGTHPCLVWGKRWWAIAKAYDAHYPESHQRTLDREYWRRRGVLLPPVTHCPQGHEYTDANTSRSDGKRRCRTCMRERARERRLRAAS